MKTRLLILFALVGLSLLIPQALGEDLESADMIQDFDKTFSIIQKQVKYVIPYKITSGTVDDMKLNCDPPSLVLSISSSDSGVLELDLPLKMIGNVYDILVDKKEWHDEGESSIDGNILTVNFPDNTNTIEFKGSYQLSSNDDDGVCDVIHNPPYSYILPHDPYTDDERLRLASEKKLDSEETMGFGSGIGFFDESNFQLNTIIIAIIIGVGSALGLTYYLRKRK